MNTRNLCEVPIAELDETSKFIVESGGALMRVSESRIQEIVETARTSMKQAALQLDTAMKDLEMVTSGFQYKEREW